MRNPKPQHGGYVDAQTGELFDLVAVPRDDRRAQTSGGWFMAMQDALSRAAEMEWPEGDYKVLVALLGRLDWDNFIHLNVSDLADNLHRSRESVSRSISRLVNAGALHRGPRVGRAYTYRLDPRLGWKGTPKGRSAALAEAERRGMALVRGDGEQPTQSERLF